MGCKAELLRKIAKRGQHGHPRTPRTLILTGSYGEWTRHGRGLSQWEFAEVVELSKRFRRFCFYVSEVAPEWKTVDEIFYADNSACVEQVCKCGEHARRRMLTPPSGDVSF